MDRIRGASLSFGCRSISRSKHQPRKPRKRLRRAVSAGFASWTQACWLRIIRKGLRCFFRGFLPLMILQPTPNDAPLVDAKATSTNRQRDVDLNAAGGWSELIGEIV